jgi:hypothetical protein
MIKITFAVLERALLLVYYIYSQSSDKIIVYDIETEENVNMK